MLSSPATLLLTGSGGEGGKKSTAVMHGPTRPHVESNRENTVSRQSPFGTTNQKPQPADHVEYLNLSRSKVGHVPLSFKLPSQFDNSLP